MINLKRILIGLAIIGVLLCSCKIVLAYRAAPTRIPTEIYESYVATQEVLAITFTPTPTPKVHRLLGKHKVKKVPHVK